MTNSTLSMVDIEKALSKVRGGPVMTSNQLHDLAQALNNRAGAPIFDEEEQRASDNKFYTAQLLQRAGAALGLDADNTSWFEVVGEIEKWGNHTDSLAVLQFSAKMRDKMQKGREEKGRGGWELTDPVIISELLRGHVEKGDPVDVANFCMMLSATGNSIAPVPADRVDRLAQSLAQMIIEWVDGGIKMGTDWRPGLASVIARRTTRVLNPGLTPPRGPCPHEVWTEESAENGYRSQCAQCGKPAAGSCQ